MTLGVSAWFGSILCLVLTLVNRHRVWYSIGCRGDMVRSTLWLVLMVGSVAWDFVQTEPMVLKTRRVSSVEIKVSLGIV